LEAVDKQRFTSHGVPTLAYAKRLVMIGNVTVGGVAAFAAWREARTTQKMLRTLAAHQLRTPLSVVVGTLHTIQKHKDRLTDEKLCDLLAQALNETQELERLVSAFMTLEPEQVRDATGRRPRRPGPKRTPVVHLDEPTAQHAPTS
jgi:signal transduction histidine kinase